MYAFSFSQKKARLFSQCIYIPCILLTASFTWILKVYINSWPSSADSKNKALCYITYVEWLHITEAWRYLLLEQAQTQWNKMCSCFSGGFHSAKIFL